MLYCYPELVEYFVTYYSTVMLLPNVLKITAVL